MKFLVCCHLQVSYKCFDVSNMLRCYGFKPIEKNVQQSLNTTPTFPQTPMISLSTSSWEKQLQWQKLKKVIWWHELSISRLLVHSCRLVGVPAPRFESRRHPIYWIFIIWRGFLHTINQHRYRATSFDQKTWCERFGQGVDPCAMQCAKGSLFAVHVAGVSTSGMQYTSEHVRRLHNASVSNNKTFNLHVYVTNVTVCVQTIVFDGMCLTGSHDRGLPPSNFSSTHILPQRETISKQLFVPLPTLSAGVWGTRNDGMRAVREDYY